MVVGSGEDMLAFGDCGKSFELEGEFKDGFEKARSVGGDEEVVKL